MKIYVIMRASPKGNRLGAIPRGKSGQHRARQSLTATVRKNRESTTETYTAGSLAPITRLWYHDCMLGLFMKLQA